MQQIVVSKQGDGDFTQIQEAIDSVRVYPLEPVQIFIKNGIYEEIITIPDNKPYIHLLGEDREKTIIINDKFARMKDESGKEIGTFQTAVFYLYADQVILENLTIQNKAGFGDDIGQAVALYVSGDRCSFKNIKLLGNQDTFFTAKGRQYFNNSYIEGHVDFIFGSGTVVFDQCTIHSLRQGYITAASTPRDVPFGFIFRNCKLTGEAEPDSVYLGRPWRPYAHTAFIQTEMGNHIKKAGWNNWRDKNNEQTARYYEYKNFGPGAKTFERVPWSKQLNDEEITNYTLENIFHFDHKWDPNE